MKTSTFRFCLAALASACSLVSFTGCQTPAQAIATANYLAGNAYATYELGRNPGAVDALEHLASVLPSIPLGKVSPTELGQLNAQLAASQSSTPKNSQLYNQIGSLISALSQANAAANGGNPTINTALLLAAVTDAANGIQHGVDFWKGQQSVENPPPAAPAPADSSPPSPPASA